jgi:hypothetical protein
MFSIDMGGCDILLGVEWLHTLDPILMDFKELTMQFEQDSQQYKFQGISTSSPEIISSHQMENILKKGHSGIISQLKQFKPLRYHMCILTSNLSSLNTKINFSLPMAFPLPAVFMIILFL